MLHLKWIRSFARMDKKASLFDISLSTPQSRISLSILFLPLPSLFISHPISPSPSHPQPPRILLSITHIQLLFSSISPLITFFYSFFPFHILFFNLTLPSSLSLSSPASFHSLYHRHVTFNLVLQRFTPILSSYSFFPFHLPLLSCLSLSSQAYSHPPTLFTHDM